MAEFRLSISDKNNEWVSVTLAGDIDLATKILKSIIIYAEENKLRVL